MLGVRKEGAPDKTLPSFASKTERVYKERVETNLMNWLVRVLLVSCDPLFGRELL